MNSIDPRSRTMRGSPTQGFAMSSAEAAAYARKTAEDVSAALRAGAKFKAQFEKGVNGVRGFSDGLERAKRAFAPGPIRDAFVAGTAAVEFQQKFTDGDLAPALVRFQTGLSAKAAKDARDWFDTLFKGIKNGGVNIDGAVQSLWDRAQVQAFTVPVIGEVTLADLRSDVFDVGRITRAFDSVNWEKVSTDIISGLAPDGGLADTAMQTIREVKGTLDNALSLATSLKGAEGLVSGLQQLSGLVGTVMPYALAVVALVAIGEWVYDLLDDSDESEEAMKAARAEYNALKDYIGDLLYSREQSHFYGTVRMRCDELAWEAVVAQRVRGILKRKALWRMPRPTGQGGTTQWVEVADRFVATANFVKDAHDPSFYYTDPEWQRLATWSSGDRFPRKSIRTEDILPGSEARDFKRVTKAIKTANKFLRSVINHLSQDSMSLDDKRVAFELLGIQILSDASHFSNGLWGRLRPTAYPTNPLPPATGLVERNNGASPLRPVRPQQPSSTLPPQEIQALGAKELASVVASTSQSPYGQQALEVLAACFTPPVSTFISSRGASGPLPPRSFVVNRTTTFAPIVVAPQPSLYLSPLSQIEVAASLMYAGGQWNLAGLTAATAAPGQPHRWPTVTETLPLGGSTVDWCYRVVVCRFRCGHVSAAAVKVIGLVNDAPEVWQRGPVKRDGSLRPPFATARGTVFLGETSGIATDALTAALVSPVGKSLLTSLEGRDTWTPERLSTTTARLTTLVSALPSDAPLEQTGPFASSWSKPLMVGLVAAIGVGAWSLARSQK